MENWKFALSSIMSHKMRSFLTMLGIIIGVASVVIIMALGNGMKKNVTDSFTANSQDVQIYYEPEKADEKFKDDGVMYYGPMIAENAPKIEEEWVVKAVEAVEGVDSYFITNSTMAAVAAEKKKADTVNITGVNKTYFKVKKYKVLAGRMFSELDYRSFARIVMLDTKLAVKLFGSNEKALNKVVSLGSKSYRVVGIYEDPNAGSVMYGMNSEGNAIMTNTQLAAEFGVDENASVFVHIDDSLRLAELGAAVATQVTKFSAVKSGKFTTFDMTALMADINQQFSLMTTIIGSIAGISLLVGGIGVMNIMLVSVTERTREIGLRKALGATRKNILTQFLIEAIVLTLLGGVIGLALAFAITGIISRPSLPAQVSLDVAAISVIFSAAIGIAFGLLPANKASKLDPIEALRYE